jgi:hypothetical protein
VPIANIPLNEAPPDEVSLCLPGLVYCGNGVCVDIYIDSFNCGGCGITCPYPQGCQGGVCVGADSPCLPGLVLCGDGMGVCVDTSVDSFNCGGCGITCQFPQGCQGGVCVG